MSLSSLETSSISRRRCLQWAAGAALLPIIARSACPCGDVVSPPSNTDIADGPLVALRVCADPNNLPYSNRDREGFEDKIAELVAKDLGVPLQYNWLPQRLGFFRTALKTYDSDLVMAAPAGFDKAVITIPYYRSTYVFVQRDGDVSTITSLDDARLKSKRIGVQLTGSVTPPTIALGRRGIVDNLVGYPVFDESAGKPAEKIVNDVAKGTIDLAIIWGPQAGYFAHQSKTKLSVLPIAPATDGEGSAAMPFTFPICMALRRSDKALRDRINGIIAARKNEIAEILSRYSVPQLPLPQIAKG